MTGWQAVVNALREEGVKYVFGLPGNPRELYDALYDATDIKPILVRHEAAGGFMALAYSILTNEPAVCFASPGPGVSHLAAPMLEALATCTPIIAPCPGVDERIKGKGAFQEADQIGMMAPVTKWTHHVSTPENIPWAINRAFTIATNGQPGPVFLEIPSTFGRAVVEMSEYVPATRGIRSSGDPARMEEAARLLTVADHPVLIVGGGVNRSDAGAEAKELAELLGMPILTTPSGRGSIEEDHPLAVGQVGLYRTEVGRQLYEQADVVLLAGSRNEQTQTGSWEWIPSDAKYIQIDICPEELGCNVKPDVAILGDAKLVLSALAQIIRTTSANPMWPRRGEAISAAKRQYEHQVDEECKNSDVPLKTKVIVHEINRVFGKDTILVHENGSQDLWTYYWPYYRVLSPRGTVAPGEQTCMGMGVMGAVGAKLARPDMHVVCVTGDGAFQMYSQDIPTAVQYEAPVTWVILNNYSLGWIKYHEKLLGERFIAVDFEAQPNFVAFGEACGCHAERVEDPKGVVTALKRAKSANEQGQPSIIDFVVDPWDFPPAFREYVR